MKFDPKQQALVGNDGSLPLLDHDEIARKLAMLIEGECEGFGPSKAASRHGFSKQRYFQLRDAYRKHGAAALQSNWHHVRSFSRKLRNVQSHLDLEEHRYDQIPTASNHSIPDNFAKPERFARRHIAARCLAGFLQTPWCPTLPAFRGRHVEAIEQVSDVRQNRR